MEAEWGAPYSTPSPPSRGIHQLWVAITAILLGVGVLSAGAYAWFTYSRSGPVAPYGQSATLLDEALPLAAEGFQSSVNETYFEWQSFFTPGDPLTITWVANVTLTVCALNSTDVAYNITGCLQIASSGFATSGSGVSGVVRGSAGNDPIFLYFECSSGCAAIAAFSWWVNGTSAVEAEGSGDASIPVGVPAVGSLTVGVDLPSGYSEFWVNLTSGDQFDLVVEGSPCCLEGSGWHDTLLWEGNYEGAGDASLLILWEGSTASTVTVTAWVAE